MRNNCLFFLRGSVDIENGQKGRKTWNYDPLTILGKNIWKIEKKKLKKVKKWPKNQYLLTSYFLLPVRCFHDFVSFLRNFVWKLTGGFSNWGYLYVKKTEYLSSNTPKKIKGLGEMPEELGKHQVLSDFFSFFDNKPSARRLPPPLT